MKAIFNNIIKGLILKLRQALKRYKAFIKEFNNRFFF